MCRVNRRLRRHFGILALVGGLLATSPAAFGDEPTELPREVRDVQRSLGGPVVDQFPSLREAPTDAPWWRQFNGQSNLANPTTVAAPDEWRQQFASPSPWPSWSGAAAGSGVVTAAAVQPDPRQTARVGALRESAAQLDSTANRLESLDLYGHADAVRNIAQRLRLEARSLAGGVQPRVRDERREQAENDPPRRGLSRDPYRAPAESGRDWSDPPRSDRRPDEAGPRPGRTPPGVLDRPIGPEPRRDRRN